MAEAKALREISIGTIAIMPNDAEAYREASFDNAKVFAAKMALRFSTSSDVTQKVARAYGAQCTPDFFGFNAQDELQHRGRLDASRMTPMATVRRDLFEALKQIAETGTDPRTKLPQNVGERVIRKARFDRMLVRSRDSMLKRPSGASYN